MSKNTLVPLALTSVLFAAPLAVAEEDTASPATTSPTPPASQSPAASESMLAPAKESEREGEEPEDTGQNSATSPGMAGYGPMSQGMMSRGPGMPCWASRGGMRGPMQGCRTQRRGGCAGRGTMAHGHKALYAKYRKLMGRLDVLEARMAMMQTMLERLMER